MDDKPLSDWVERRDAKIGKLRATPVVTGDGPKGAHVNPNAPRVIERWNGHLWEPYALVCDLAEARRILHPEAKEPAPSRPVPRALGQGSGRHRKPRTP
ncbi:DUF6087 family protein [Kitasatospora kifunensis]|uniref:DUF6087 family protein n=1 Tax=Kitasatospora kifunensis TaxID=58351 RepID=UPI001C87981F|nr:DUF6087 family protein [Kitasatospora kifunensis]